MSEHENVELDAESVARRRVGCFVTYLNPFRLVESEILQPWNATIDQVNSRSWDYAALHEMAGGIKVGLPDPYCLIVARDGALALPPIEGLRSIQEAVEFLNRCLAGLLVGGVYCEAVTPDSIDMGSIIDWRYIRSYRSGQASPNRFHEQIRRGQASALEAIALYGPRTISLLDLTIAMRTGLDALGRVTPLRGEFLLKGVTGIARRDWGTALANLWIAVEQVVSFLWQKEVIEPTVKADPSKSRRGQLSDTRTWTASARLEMLFQKGVLSSDIITSLSMARKARNDLSHEGTPPSERDAYSAYEGFCGIFSIALGGDRPPLFDINLSNHLISDPFAPPGPIEGEVVMWMEIPKLPGEKELELAEAQLRKKSRHQERR